MKLAEFIDFHPQLKEAREICFFGGSFNPWHEGHSACIKLLRKKIPLIVIPDHNPQKQLQSIENKATSFAELEVILTEFKQLTFLYTEFAKKNEVNPTTNWVQVLKKAKPELKISLLMGHDTFEKIDTWIDGHKLLLCLNKLYVASRLETTIIKTTQINNLRSIAPELEISFLGHHDYEELSSTNIRERDQHALLD